MLAHDLRLVFEVFFSGMNASVNCILRRIRESWAVIVTLHRHWHTIVHGASASRDRDHMAPECSSVQRR